jgi:hypothetical protein
VAVALIALVCGATRAAPPQPPAEKDLARLFRFHAAAQAEALRDAVERASLDEPLRDALRQLVRQHLRRADDEAARAAAAYSTAAATSAGRSRGDELDDFIARAAELARDFNDARVAAWLDEHPSAYQPVQEQIALADAYERAVAEEPDAVARAAVAAGLPAAQEADLRRVIAATHDKLTREGEAAEKRLREAAERAGAARPAEQPPSQPQPPPTSVGPAPAPGLAQAPAPAPPPASPGLQALQLLDAMTEIDAHARGVQGGRQVRGEVERLLTQPSQRKAMSDEMLRWLQNHAPPEDAPREGVPLRRPAQPRPRTAPPTDPGF